VPPTHLNRSFIPGPAKVALFRVLSRTKRVSSALSLLGDVADYAVWVKATFGQVEVFSKREDLWEFMARRVHGRLAIGIEFGVAFGYAAWWWLTRVSRTTLLSWDGFDRFTGLPRSWRAYPHGAFDAQGVPPELGDERARWHVGDIESTIEGADLPSLRSSVGVWIVIFDFDLYEPSLVAWESIRHHLQPGDLLYFDEAFDRDERHLVVHHVLPSARFLPIGVTPTGLCLEVVEVTA
jgi:hypothetical protein